MEKLGNVQGFHEGMLEKYILYYETIDSTQKEIWRRIEAGNIEEGTVIIADLQTDGIGTHGRKWYTSQENNIAFSFVLFPNVPVKELDRLTLQIAEIMVGIFQEMYGISLEIKEPNDLMVGKRKLGGILTETKLQGEIVKDLVIGIGLNTNQSSFDREIENIATSIKNEFHIQIDNKVVIQEFLNQFEESVMEKKLHLK